ncbi:MAG: hypothetical protein ACREA9_23265 [Pyrinomonadaceae bacterium]
MDLYYAIGIAIVTLVVLGGPIAYGLQYAFTFAKTHWPKLPPAAGLFSAKIELPIWKVAALVAAFWFLSGGTSLQGCKLPTIIGSAPPFKTDALAVLVVEESSPSEGATPAWINSTKAGGIRGYVESRGGEFRLIDKDNASDLLDQKWKDAFAAKGATVPWIIAAGPRAGFSRALPPTAAETIKALEGAR